MIYAAVLAGGTGSRFGSSVPKQFLFLGGKPILIRSLESFLEIGSFRRVLTLCPEEWTDYTRAMIDRWLPGFSVPVLPGGPTRNETLMRAIRAIEQEDGLDDETRIVTHDAVRPLVPRSVIEAHIEALDRWDACDTVIPATDTIVVSTNGKTTREIPDRSILYASQTPQSFRAAALLRYYETLTDEDRARLTDACRIFVMHGQEVALIPGSRRNLKITWPEDIRVAEALLQEDIRKEEAPEED